MIHRNRLGFTLVEILVVVGILLIIVAVLAASFSGVFSKSDETQTQATIETLKTNLNSFNAAWGIYPPSNLNDLGQQTGASNLQELNATNRGIETMLLALRSGLERGPYIDGPLFADDEVRMNLDADRVLPDTFDAEFLDIPQSESTDLFEIVDRWGNPLVYIDVQAVINGTVDESIVMGNGDTVKITATECQEKLRHPTTGQYPQGFVLWSFGEDQKNDYGRGDDLTSWDKYEE
ncbi:MAG: type II secretion system protein [Planctomycetota bacterium]|jgi:prepilin-type N-terminal cleavage/methylation domain-containing protein